MNPLTFVDNPAKLPRLKQLKSISQTAVTYTDKALLLRFVVGCKRESISAYPQVSGAERSRGSSNVFALLGESQEIIVCRPCALLVIVQQCDAVNLQ